MSEAQVTILVVALGTLITALANYIQSRANGKMLRNGHRPSLETEADEMGIEDVRRYTRNPRDSRSDG